MNTQDFIEKFAEALEIEDASSLVPETEFRSLEEWDSINYLSVIAMMDEEYDIQIEQPEFKKLNTIQSIVDYIETHK